MRNDNLDKYIKEAIYQEAEENTPDTEKIWQNIESNIDFIEEQKNTNLKNNKRYLFYKIAACFLVFLVTSSLLFGIIQTGEALPFGSVFENFIERFIGGTQKNIQFGEMPSNDISISEVIGEELEQVGPTQVDFIESSLSDLLNVYPNQLYIPKLLAQTSPEIVRYLEVNENKWIIEILFVDNEYDVVFKQKDLLENDSDIKSIDVESAEISFHRLEGIEYKIIDHRYNLLEINWIKDNKQFTIIGNITKEHALDLAKSVDVYLP